MLAQLAAITAIGAAVLGISASSASAAALPANLAKFANCPVSDPDVSLCVYIHTSSLKLTLGRYTLTSTDPITLEFGVKFDPDTFAPTTVAPSNGHKILTAGPIQIPGGISGVPGFDFWPLTAYVTPTLVGLPSINTGALRSGHGAALSIDLKGQVSNPFISGASFFGPGCYIGSDGNPISLRLTTGTTAPPSPNTPISGAFTPGVGTGQATGGLYFAGEKVVDNAFAGPGAQGCGLGLGGLDAVINADAHLPSAAGTNTAIVTADIYTVDGDTLRTALGMPPTEGS